MPRMKAKLDQKGVTCSPPVRAWLCTPGDHMHGADSKAQACQALLSQLIHRSWVSLLQQLLGRQPGALNIEVLRCLRPVSTTPGIDNPCTHAICDQSF